MTQQRSPFQRVYSGAPWEQKVGYCRAIKAGPHIHVTGTVAIDDHGRIYAPNDPFRQTERCLQIIERALEKLGASRRSIVRTRMFVTDISHWEVFGRAHAEFFEGEHPSTSMLEIKGLIEPDALIEIEVDAYVGST